MSDLNLSPMPREDKIAVYEYADETARQFYNALKVLTFAQGRAFGEDPRHAGAAILATIGGLAAIATTDLVKRGEEAEVVDKIAEMARMLLPDMIRQRDEFRAAREADEKIGEPQGNA